LQPAQHQRDVLRAVALGGQGGAEVGQVVGQRPLTVIGVGVGHPVLPHGRVGQ
jgi:hypothetical protein